MSPTRPHFVLFFARLACTINDQASRSQSVPELRAPCMCERAGGHHPPKKGRLAGGRAGAEVTIT